jgi:hypothetical protein
MIERQASIVEESQDIGLVGREAGQEILGWVREGMSGLALDQQGSVTLEQGSEGLWRQRRQALVTSVIGGAFHVAQQGEHLADPGLLITLHDKGQVP